jgi:NhaP-type Na+/H+ or K+/H+ antiporter
MSVIGLLVGAVFGVLAILADWKKSIDKESYLGFNLALTALVLGGVELLGGDSILAVFFAGSLFSSLFFPSIFYAFTFSVEIRSRDRVFLERTLQRQAANHRSNQRGRSDHFFFILMGTILPFDKWADIGNYIVIYYYYYYYYYCYSFIINKFGTHRHREAHWSVDALASLLPFVMLFKPVTRQIRTWKESIFVGWFGPVGTPAPPPRGYPGVQC